MKTLYLVTIIGISLISMFLMSGNSFAYTCAVKASSVPLQYYYLHADSVFVGTVSSITNDTNHQYTVKFDLVKSWKGSQHPTMITYNLVSCGYSFVKGEKYLVFAAGYPPDYFEWATKPFGAAQDEIALFDSPQFQAQANADEELYKKLVNARDAISNMMGSRMSHIPISSVGVNDLNFTLDVGIADKKAALPSGAEEYKQKLEEIVGNVPIRVQYGEYATALPEIITQHIALSSPLKQFKSGIASLNVKCKQDFLLIIKSKDDLPACTRPITALSLLERGWGQITSPFDTTTDLLDSKILGGTISKYHYDLQSKIILINVQTASDGNLTVTIPRKLIDAQVGDTDAQFFVLEDGQEILYKEIHKTIQDRILSIPIQKGIEQIEIIGANQT